MRAKTSIAWVVGLALVASAGVAAATYQGRSIWGGNNPGQGADHANMPDAAAENNRAGADHPFPDQNNTHGNDTGGDNETSEANETGGQPADVPPAHAKDGQPSSGKPDDVPPAHAGAPSNETA